MAFRYAALPTSVDIASDALAISSGGRDPLSITATNAANPAADLSIVDFESRLI
ncbi:hypothetical protein AB4Y32_30405 [Paraburkholderia phymatum]|uniref:Uncharacterized protein n=1 Tax=Paraburkholderia phymatum TaxID=148447 RepID=A0ACC6U950_9BURK